MIPRYSNPRITEIWSDANKLKLWQATELAVIQARSEMGVFPSDAISRIEAILEKKEIDLDWWLARDKEIHHDLNAFLDERLRHLPVELHQFFHEKMTSYDTEEPPMSLMLIASAEEVINQANSMMDLLWDMMRKYRHTPMLGRTHGQEAKLQSFGKRVFTWHIRLYRSVIEMHQAIDLIIRSKLSGAIGNYQGVSPEEEEKALQFLGLTPFKGATQIMPRQLHQPLVNSLVMIVSSLTQIAEDIRLAARSGNPILQEPFGKKQKGSSAMPHKKNTITCENQIGMLILAKGFARMLQDCQVTWEERSIEQSSVERIAWPDLFHVVMNSFKNMNRVLSGLRVNTDNMLLEIHNSRGCYASEEAKEWLKKKGADFLLEHEDAYRIVQLASFIVHEPYQSRKKLRERIPVSYEEAQEILDYQLAGLIEATEDVEHIGKLISEGNLRPVDELDISAGQIRQWNHLLMEIFDDPDNQASWQEIFQISYHLRNEKVLITVHHDDEN